MTAGIMCRRFSGPSYRAAAFSTTTRSWGKKIFLRKTEECQSTKERNKESKPPVKLRLWKPPEYRVFFNPLAYPGAKCVYHGNASVGLEDGLLESDYSTIGAKQVRNTYSITCSRRLSSTRNTLLDLENNKALSTQASSMQPTRSVPVKDDEQIANVEDYDTKEDPRTFQKQRPEYRSLCYSRYELPDPLSMEECNHILQKVAVLKSSLKPGTIADYFLRLSCLPEEQRLGMMSNARFAMLCRYGVENIQAFDISELIAVLRAFVGLAIPPMHSMLNVYETECCRRAWNMNLDQQLLVADLWRCLGRVVPRYLEIVLSYVNLHWKNLTLPQLVQLVYIIGEGRKAPEELVQKLDVLVLKQLDSLNLEEVGAICLGFFKSQNGLSEQTMRKIGDKVSARVADISNYALVNVLKMFRYTHVDHMDFLKQLGNVVPPRIPTIGIQGVMHITLACSALHYLNEKVMNAVAASVPPRAAYCRSKDIAKLLWSFGCLNYEPPNAEEFYASLEEQMHAKLNEFNKFPEHLLTCLLALTFAKRFPYDLIDYALSPGFLKLSSKSKFELQKDFFTLDGTVEIECPDYKGHRLTPQFRQEVAEMLWDLAKKENCMKVDITEAFSLLQDMLGGPQYIKHHMILPHTRSTDLEIHLDANQKPLPFNSEAASTVKLELKENGVVLTDDLMTQLVKGKVQSHSLMSGTENKIEMQIEERETTQEQSLSTWNHFSFTDGVPLTGDILNALTKSKMSSEGPHAPLSKQQTGGMKLAVQVSNRNHYCYGSKHLLGLHSLKRRQLSRIGYVVIEIPFWEWFPLLRHSRSEKLSYLHYKLFGSLV
ncbi:FAST kinase domain-containing protein 5, mitochondrial [Sceloporus undulatus]|uniref:FAST kinase domain-containing protein 5, mitochondrial n=1 Tax=Sceloporus undulatus TaxID=8520 RepID=UPI001C4C1E37|nr:FAST kinase domain-containing protein 5, mitochondrial [Sceloporus undulatus]XP_042324765.1 FAST kinase domain-containing protein 5, mitochondrial [Sceloporus undulatus]XP_042324767.1 FAST kinase domain-containing protein 5, mitochondrial [Sceloporus undulatus]